jgi:hypothetical protein
MAKMTDPSDALASFQQFLPQLELIPGEIDPTLSIHTDAPNGETRLTYARVENGIVTAIAILFQAGFIDKSPCFQIGYAVPEALRGQKKAQEIVAAAIAEMQNGFGRAGIPTFYVEAIVGDDNPPSQHVAAAVLSDQPVAVTDSLSGLPALQYLRKVGA